LRSILITTARSSECSISFRFSYWHFVYNYFVSRAHDPVISSSFIWRSNNIWRGDEVTEAVFSSLLLLRPSWVQLFSSTLCSQTSSVCVLVESFLKGKWWSRDWVDYNLHTRYLDYKHCTFLLILCLMCLGRFI
jgi:hypothetical protein